MCLWLPLSPPAACLVWAYLPGDRQFIDAAAALLTSENADAAETKGFDVARLASGDELHIRQDAQILHTWQADIHLHACNANGHATPLHAACTYFWWNSHGNA